MAFLANVTNAAYGIGADRIGEFACAKFSSRCKRQICKKCLIAFLATVTNAAYGIGADRIGEFACAKFSSRCKR